MTNRGLFISLEGGDGSGKSTQLKLLAERFLKKGYRVVENVEPGGTAIGQQIRRILLDPVNEELSPVAELLLMFASRAQAAQQRINPALEGGDIVLSDRFTDSSLAYQGEARGLGFELVRDIHRLTLGELQPDLTIYLETDLAASLSRAKGRNNLASGTTIAKETRLDEQSFEFHQKVREGYRRIAQEEPRRFKIVDGNATPEVVAGRVWSVVEPLLNESR